MKFKKWAFAFVLSLAATSCIQNEALNSEAAIDACTGLDIQSAIIDATDKTIQLYVSKAADRSKTNIDFQIPTGATIAPVEPLSGDNAPYYDFKGKKERSFKVTSEDKAYESVYRIILWQTEIPQYYGFETLSSSSPYHKFSEQDNSSESAGILRQIEWASGNPGFELTKMAKSPSEYPTVQTTEGVNGSKCLKLETKNTGSFGAMVGMYIAAGNLFIGSFDVSKALQQPREATNFGMQFYKHPKKLKGYYKFKPGDVYTAEGQEQPNEKDRFDIYGVLYEADDNSFTLNGNTSLNSPNIVALARIDDAQAYEQVDKWKPFELEFVQKNGKVIDEAGLQKGKYKLSIVLSSSEQGAYFKGAVGSTLYVDELQLICEEDNNQ